MGLGTTEIIVILLIVLIIFGGSRIPQLGKGLGEGLRNFREAMRGGASDETKPTSVDKPKSDDQNKKA